MCLITAQKEPQIATEPITVYKGFVRREDGSYISPIREYNFGILNVGDTIKPEEREVPYENKEENCFVVSGGYIYAYIEKDVCENCLNYIYHQRFVERLSLRISNALRMSQAKFIEDSLVMAECVIPTGASYYVDKKIGKEICASEMFIKSFHKYSD